jgi:hypothetical protein
MALWKQSSSAGEFLQVLPPKQVHSLQEVVVGVHAVRALRKGPAQFYVQDLGCDGAHNIHTDAILQVEDVIYFTIV